MSLILPVLPAQTEYEPKQVTASTFLNPAFGGPIQRMARKGGRWAIDVSIPALSAKKCGPALIADLVQDTETVVMRFPERINKPASYGTPRINGAGSAGRIIPVDGLLDILIPKGKFLSIRISNQYFLYNVSEDSLPVGGAANIKIWPMLRRQPPDNAVIELLNPVIEGFVQQAQTWRIGNSPGMPINFTIVEAE